jgi:hypothetical protein
LPNRYTTKLNAIQLIENKQRRSPQIATKSRFFAGRCVDHGRPDEASGTDVRCLYSGAQAYRTKPQHQNEQNSTQVTENKPGARRQAATEMHFFALSCAFNFRLSTVGLM